MENYIKILTEEINMMINGKKEELDEKLHEVYNQELSYLNNYMRL